MKDTSSEAWLATTIAGEIEAILPTYPQYPYQRVFADLNVKQQLIDYVLKQVPRKSSIVGASAGSIGSGKPSNSQLDQLRVLVHLGLVDVLRDNTDCPRVVNIDGYLSDNEPSHWFG